MKKISKAQFVQRYEASRLTKILIIEKWLVALSDEGEPNSEMVYLELP